MMNRNVKRSLRLLTIGLVVGLLVGSAITNRLTGVAKNELAKVEHLEQQLDERSFQLIQAQQPPPSLFPVVYHIRDFYTGATERTVELGVGDLKDGKVALYDVYDEGLEAIVADQANTDSELYSHLSDNNQLYEEGNQPR